MEDVVAVLLDEQRVFSENVERSPCDEVEPFGCVRIIVRACADQRSVDAHKCEVFLSVSLCNSCEPALAVAAEEI